MPPSFVVWEKKNAEMGSISGWLDCGVPRPVFERIDAALLVREVHTAHRVTDTVRLNPKPHPVRDFFCLVPAIRSVFIQISRLPASAIVRWQVGEVAAVELQPGQGHVRLCFLLMQPLAAMARADSEEVL